MFWDENKVFLTISSERVQLWEPSFHLRTPKSFNFHQAYQLVPMSNCRLRFAPRRNHAANFGVIVKRRLHVCRRLLVAVSVAAGMIFCYSTSIRLKLNVVCLKLTYFIHKSLRRREPANSWVSGSGQAAVWAEAKPKLKKCQSSKFWAAEMFTRAALPPLITNTPKLRPKPE